MKFKNILPDITVIVLFALIPVVYFFVPISDGLVLSGHDHVAAVGAGQEVSDFAKDHPGERSFWTNSLFGGMPTYQIAPSYPTTKLLGQVQKVLGLGMPELLTYVFLMLLGFNIMCRAFNFKVWMAALGAIVWAFSSYFFIIIAAGHIWKVYALAYIPGVIAGVVWCMRGKLLTGAIVTALFTALEVLSNHVQMTYYFLPVIAVVALCYIKGSWRQWVPRAVTCILAALIGISINLTNLYHTWEYSKETMRGKSELTSVSAGVTTENQTSSGLDRDYITAWSYGIDETWSLLVPKINGGSSMDRLSQDETAMKHANYQYNQIYQSLPQYFGDQPFTAGPVYVGSIVLMLALMSLFVARSPLVYCLLGLTVLSILLSWGHNLMWFTNLFLDYVPMYDKFRTVSSILVVAEFCIPLMAMLALKRLIEGGVNRKQVLIPVGITAFVTLLIALVPDMFVTRFVSAQETSMLQNASQAGYLPQEMLSGIIASVTEMRKAVVSADAWRSLGFIAAGAVCIAVFIYNKVKAPYMIAALIVLSLADMWGVNKRYLNDSMFSQPKATQQSFAKTETDELILQDTSLDYRVLNLASDTYNENQTSYWHKSIGGYHAAKLRRYQELIEYRLRPESQKLMSAVIATQGDLTSLADSTGMTAAGAEWTMLNALNTHWAIMGLQNGITVPVSNPYAYGNAWFVDNVQFVENADQEIAAIEKTDLRTTAVVDKRFKTILNVPATQAELGDARITMTEYLPNRLTYKTSGNGGVAVFSEIYYPGWRATIDGKEVDVARADYVLRTLVIPAGDHTIEMRFDPQSMHITEGIAWTAWTLLALLIIAGGVIFWRKQKNLMKI